MRAVVRTDDGGGGGLPSTCRNRSVDSAKSTDGSKNTSASNCPATEVASNNKTVGTWVGENDDDDEDDC